MHIAVGNTVASSPLEMIVMVDKVSGFINEVKRVTEMYASVFDSLLQESGLAEVNDMQECMLVSDSFATLIDAHSLLHSLV